jgi:ParB family chromosome partitioning protein
MVTKKNVLGKGLGALLNTNIATPAYEDTPPPTSKKNNNERNTKSSINRQEDKSEPIGAPALMPLEKIRANPNQPRRVFDDTKIAELSQSIKENGLIQPIIVAYDDTDNMYEIIAGERRFRASKLAGLERVPVVVKKVTQKDKYLMAIIENVQRSDLNCVEEALAYFKLMEDFKLTQEEVAKKIGKERSSIANYLRILKLPKDLIILLQKDLLSFGHAKVLSGNDEQLVRELGKKAVAEKWSVRVLEEELKKAQAEKTGPTGAKIKDSSDQISREDLDSYRLRMERKTGFHIEVKGKRSKGHVVLKYTSPTEFSDIVEYFLS